MAAILVVDDDRDIRELLTDALTEEGHTVQAVTDGQAALAALQDQPFDLALVDIRLPGLSGLELVPRLKELAAAMSVMIITGRRDSDAILQALRTGVYDYVTKPFDLEYLRSAVRKALAGRCPPEQLQIGDLILDLAMRQAWWGKQPLDLTTTEFELLAYLAQRSGQIVTYEELLEQVWHCQPWDGSTELVRTAVWRLRQKIEPDPAQPCLLVTVRGVGYRLNTPTAEYDAGAIVP